MPPASPAPSSATSRFALWDLGFRPFFLLASLYSVFSVLLWVAQYSGLLSHAYLRGPLWHAHEMLFGYTIAVIAGFLLTTYAVLQFVCGPIMGNLGDRFGRRPVLLGSLAAFGFDYL